MTLATRRLLSHCALAAALLVVMACSQPSATARSPAPTPRGEFMLQVVNHHWLDVAIYVIHDGTRTRVATVSASSTQNIVLSGRLLGTARQIYLIGEAIGSPDEVRTETLVVQPGQYVAWTLESSLRRSSVGVY